VLLTEVPIADEQDWGVIMKRRAASTMTETIQSVQPNEQLSLIQLVSRIDPSPITHGTISCSKELPNVAQ
jgi:hypothetical protein